MDSVVHFPPSQSFGKRKESKSMQYSDLVCSLELSGVNLEESDELRVIK